MSRGGYRTWKPCEGSNRPVRKPVTQGSGHCSYCNKIVAMFRDGTTARHKGREGQENVVKQ